jgi:hypothetical protein
VDTHLNLLSVCRQTHTECRLLPFKLNTLVFNNGLRFLLFLNKATERQRGIVRRLKLDIVWTRKDELILGSRVVGQAVV